uniref:Uncharacterized protein n=1 Tax=Heterorhabditis bacteriophora TaxID=37862 RepID=A0A1I7WWJ8_HETBA
MSAQRLALSSLLRNGQRFVSFPHPIQVQNDPHSDEDPVSNTRFVISIYVYIFLYNIYIFQIIFADYKYLSSLDFNEPLLMEMLTLCTILVIVFIMASEYIPIKKKYAFNLNIVLTSCILLRFVLFYCDYKCNTYYSIIAYRLFTYGPKLLLLDIALQCILLGMWMQLFYVIVSSIRKGHPEGARRLIRTAARNGDYHREMRSWLEDECLNKQC